VKNSKSQNEFPTLPSALGNPAQIAAFPHFHRTGDGYFALLQILSGSTSLFR
jgi:hypothetical protein